MGIQDQNTENSIKSVNYLKSKKLREIIEIDIDCLAYSYKAKSISEKMSVDSLQS